MNSSPLAAIWHWYPLLAWVACARFCSLPLGSLSYLNFYRKLRLDSNFSYGTGLIFPIPRDRQLQIGVPDRSYSIVAHERLAEPPKDFRLHIGRVKHKSRPLCIRG